MSKLLEDLADDTGIPGCCRAKPMLTRRAFSGGVAGALLARPLSAQDAAVQPVQLGLAVGFNQYRWADDAALAAEFDDYVRLGVRLLRTDLYWSMVQAAGPGSFVWEAFDRVLDIAQSRGIQILPVVGIAPDWTGPDPGRFAEFVFEAAQRYSIRGLNHWEIWNEPNLAGPWPPAPDPVAYAALAAAGSSAIREANDRAFIISGGLAAVQTTGPIWNLWHYAAEDFLSIVYDRVGGDPFDAIGFHPYSYPELPDRTRTKNGWGLMSGRLRDVMIRNADADKPIWITEYGAPTSLPEVPESVQVDMLEMAHDLTARTAWLGPLFWYSYRDLGTDPDESEHWFGLRDAAGNEKLSYRAYQQLADQKAEPI